MKIEELENVSTNIFACNAQGFSLIAMVFARGRYQSGVVQQKAVFCI